MYMFFLRKFNFVVCFQILPLVREELRKVCF